MLNHSVTQDLQEKVELFLSCKGLGEFLPSNSHVKVKIYTEQGGMFALFGETEGIQNNPNPDFTRSFTLDYHFEISQKLKFEVACEENSQSIGTMQTTLGNIVGASRKIISEGFDIFGADGAKKGKLIIKYEKVEKNNQVAVMTFQSQIAQVNRGWLYYFDIFGFFSSNDYVLKLYRITNDFDYVLIYESEPHKDSLTPEWKKLQIGVTKICNSDHYRPVKAQVYTRHRSQDTLVGECQFTLNDLINETSNFTLVDPSTKNHTGTLNLRNFRVEERADFLDYIRGGTQLNVIVGIDFTGSNGDPSNPASLHALKFDGTLNEYQQAISSVCSILLDYDYDKKVPVYGFGGKPRGYPFPGVQHCFSLTGDPKNPWVSELPGIMQAYSAALRNVELSGPTLFAPLVQKAMEAAAENRNSGSREYTILLIITDGEIHDMQPTINCMIKSARLPLSVIIVGVGPSNNFENMKILDGDDGLANSEGVEAERDLVQFVPFREFENNPEALAKHVLEEIPTQLVEYMSLEGIRPPAPAQYNNGQSGGLYPDIASAPMLSGEQLQQSLNYGFVPANINFEKY